MKFILFPWIFLSSLLLSACITNTALTPATTKSESWPARQATLNQLQTWTIKGIIAVRKDYKGVNAHLNWQQQGDAYRIELFGPLGINPVQITGTPQAVALIAADNRIYRANDAEKLVEERTGYVLPVSNLYYWIRGLPAPHISLTQQLDARNRLSHLQQQGWEINYIAYMPVQALELPRSIELTRDNILVKIIITEWKNHL